MHFLSKPLVDLALNHFDHLDVSDWKQGGWFFETFGPGNVIDGTDKAHERFTDYEELLILLYERNKERYERIHKGTPFFFLSWLAFDLRNYEKALYYLDAAISEDVKNMGSSWLDFPGAQFLRLSTEPHAGSRIIGKIRTELNKQIERFNKASGLRPISLEDLLTKFVSNFIKTTSTRTIVSALYIYILEHSERATELQLRSTEGCSIGPIIGHLFSGTLVFESILKSLYPLRDDHTPVKTLGHIFNTTAFKGEFVQHIQTSAESLQEILDAAHDNTLATALTVTAKIRNTTGHNLVWDNVFHKTENYEALWCQIVNALFYVIEKKFIK